MKLQICIENLACKYILCYIWVNFINIFGTKAEQLLLKFFFMLLMATASGESMLKCGARHKSGSLKHAYNFIRNAGDT